MYAEERQQLIGERARGEGRVDVASLALEFAVTPETVRRDLTVLERHGMLRRVHGGAVTVERLSFEPALSARSRLNRDEKLRIARAALAEVPREGTILLDAGSTTAALAELLPADRDLTVVTNGLPIASLLATRPRLTVMVVGGRIRGRTLAAVDTWATGALEKIYVDVAFLGTNGISVERGLTTADPSEAAVKAAMIACSRRRILLVDHTKVGNDNFCRFGDCADLDVLITDDRLDPQLGAELREAVPRMVRA
jgi:DeoR family transcriptional regulator, fructose operon transcriptional repressor